MTILVLILIALVAGFAFSTFKIIGQAEVMVIERLGRFHRVARSGLNILIPLIERPKSIEVSVNVKNVRVNGNEATAVVRQSYKSDITKTNSTKTLKLEKNGERWLIKQERVGG